MIKKKTYKRTEKQKEAWLLLENINKNRIFLQGGARCGKTIVILLWLIYQCEKYPGLRILIARKHRQHVKSTIFDLSLKNILENVAGWERKEGELTYIHANGSMIICDGLDAQDRVDKILGSEYGIIYINEATQLDWTTTQTVITRLSQSIDGFDNHRLILDANPKSTYHWLYRVGIQHIDPVNGKPLPDAANWASLHFTPYDNLQNLPKNYIKQLESLTGVQRDRMLLGKWSNAEGLVYDIFDEDIHLTDFTFDKNIHREKKKYRAIDFGYTNPTVCLYAIDIDDQIIIYDELYQSGLTTASLGQILKNDTNRYEHTVCDKASAQDIAGLKEMGIDNITICDKNILTGIQKVIDYLKVDPKFGQPRLLISRNCKNLIGEIYEYAWKPNNNGAKEEPVKKRDHASDALRYLIVSLTSNNKLQKLELNFLNDDDDDF